MKGKTVIAVLVTVIISSAVFFACGLLLLPAELNSAPTPAGDSVSGVNYYSEEKNCSVLFLYEDGSGGLVYLDFASGVLRVSLYNDHAEEQAVKSDYDINYTVRLTSDFLCRFCDQLGGITISENGTKFRYLSAGLRQKLEEKLDYDSRLKIVSAFFEKIAKIGLSSDDFMFIIEETENNLVYPVCYGWISGIKELTENCVFE